MKKLHLFKKVILGYLPVKTAFFKRALVVIAVLIVSSNVNAQGPTVKGGLVGLVRDGVTNKPIPQALVRLFNITSRQEFATLTDERGYFKKELPPGNYLKQVSASGYQSAESYYYILVTKWSEVLIPDSLEPTTIINTTNTLPPITGNVVVASLSKTEIIVEDLETGQIYKNNILTNDSICFFDRLPAKKYKVTATLEGYKPEKKEIEIFANQTYPLTLNLIPNETSSRILFEAGKYYALVIGNNNYFHLPKLKTAENDATSVSERLRNDFGFETKLLLNATREQIFIALTELRNKLGFNDNLIIYYAGHGYNDAEIERAYWLPVDSRNEDSANWISADDITSQIKKINAKHVLVISDSCYSGTISRSNDLIVPSSKPTERESFLLKMYNGKSRTLMASGGNEPVADGGGGNNSVFAKAFLGSLFIMEKNIFTAEELYSKHIKQEVAGKAEQTPEYNPLRSSGHEGGDFVFIRKK